MVGIVVLGIYGLLVGNYQVFVWWALLPFFSPRIVGEVAFLYGNLLRGFRGGDHP